MLFGLCHFVISDDDISPECIFIVMFNTLTFKYEVVSKRNQKRVYMEKIFQLLNKVVTITSNNIHAIILCIETSIPLV